MADRRIADRVSFVDTGKQELPPEHVRKLVSATTQSAPELTR